MDRMAGIIERVTDERATALYRRAIALWAQDTLTGPRGIEWPEDEPTADYRNRDWRELYSGSVLDD